MSEEENILEIPGVDPNTNKITPFQEITISEIPNGSILDIGGGGEGVIAQVGKKRVTAIDKRQSEIEEAINKAPEAKWIVADALDLPFKDGEFDNVTSFFSGMYMSNEDKRGVIKESYRVLSAGGELWIWDSKINTDKDMFLLVLTITLPGKEAFNTGYGSRIKNQDENIYKEYLAEAGFSIKEIDVNKYWFFIRAKK